MKIIYQNIFVLLCAFQVLFVSGCGSRAYTAPAVTENFAPEESAPGSERDTAADVRAESADVGGSGKARKEETICVYICGAVRKAGVYELPSGARVYQLIEKAGGLADDADPVFVNQAELLRDGEQVTVPTKEETSGAEQGAGTFPVKNASGQDAASGRININTANAEELQRLNGIGASRAQDIIAYRENNGGFGCIEDIMKVSGIKNALFERIRDDITVG